jgi:predicted RNase H-like HicB family nuclease
MEESIYYAELPDVLGYGIAAIGRTKEEAEKAVKEKFLALKKQKEIISNPDFDTFPKAKEYFGMNIHRMIIGKGYLGGQSETEV